MKSPIIDMMLRWLESGTESQKRHAAVCLSQSDIAQDHQIKAKTARPADYWTGKIRACPDYNPGCCANPAPFCSRFAMSPSRDQCIECLTKTESEKA